MPLPSNAYKTGRSRKIFGEGSLSTRAFAEVGVQGTLAYGTGVTSYLTVFCGPLRIYMGSEPVYFPENTGQDFTAYRSFRVTWARGGSGGINDQELLNFGKPPLSATITTDLEFGFEIDVEEYYLADEHGLECRFVEYPKLGGDAKLTVSFNGGQATTLVNPITANWGDVFLYADAEKLYRVAPSLSLVGRGLWPAAAFPAYPAYGSVAYPPLGSSEEAWVRASLRLMGHDLSAGFSESRSINGWTSAVDLSGGEQPLCSLQADAGTSLALLQTNPGSTVVWGDLESSSFEYLQKPKTVISLPVRYRLREDRLIASNSQAAGMGSIESALYEGSREVARAPDSSAATYSWFDTSRSIHLLGYTYSFIDEHVGMRASLVPSSLSAAGQDSHDKELRFRGFRWDALTVSKSGSLLIDDCTSIDNWTAGPSTTLTEHITYIRIEVANLALGSAALDIPQDAQTWEGYRYLRLSGSASSAIDVVVTLAGMSWVVPISGTGDFLVDLCCATDDPGVVSTKSTRFPIQGGGPPWSAPPDEQYALGWGVEYCDSLVLSGIPGGVIFTLNDVSLVSNGDESALTLLRPYGSESYAFVQTDGRISDWPSGDPYSSPSAYTIDQMRQMLSYVTGVGVSPVTPPGDGYHNADRDAICLGGSGATYDWTSKQWKVWTDVPLSSSPLTIVAQDLFDTLRGYPGIGNPFDGSDYPGPDEDDSLPLVTRKILRGQGTGLAFKEDGTPHAGLAVSAWTTGGTLAGIGTAKIDGSYRTGSPFAPGNANVATSIDGVDPTAYSSTQVWQNRQRVRTSFRIAPVGCEGQVPSLFCPGDGSTLNQNSETCSVGDLSAGSCGCSQTYASGLPVSGPRR